MASWFELIFPRLGPGFVCISFRDVLFLFPDASAVALSVASWTELIFLLILKTFSDFSYLVSSTLARVASRSTHRLWRSISVSDRCVFCRWLDRDDLLTIVDLDVLYRFGVSWFSLPCITTTSACGSSSRDFDCVSDSTIFFAKFVKSVLISLLNSWLNAVFRPIDDSSASVLAVTLYLLV